MALSIPYADFCRRFFHGVNVAFCFIFICCISSCRQKSIRPGGYSDAFMPILDKGKKMYNSGKKVEALHYFDSSINHTKNINVNDRFRVYAFHYFYYYKTKADNKNALLYADSMLYAANLDTDNPKYGDIYAEANFSIGDALFAMDRFGESYPHYFSGLSVGEKTLNKLVLAEYYYRMGMVTYKTGTYKLAAGYFEKSYYYHPNTDNEFFNFYSKQEILDNIALSFQNNNQPDSALFYFDKALNYINRFSLQNKGSPVPIDMARAVVYGNKAEVLMSRNELNNAIALLKKSIAINSKKGYENYDAEKVEVKLGQIYYDRQQNDSLFKLLTDTRQLFNYAKNTDAEADWNRLMSGYYLRKKNFEQAFTYLHAYNAIKDSNDKKASLLRENNVNNQLDSYEKQQQIEQLNVNNKLQKIYIFGISIVAIMTLLVIFLIYRNWKRSKQDVLKVNVLNKHINEQNLALENALDELKANSHEKDRILRSVAHDLRNPIGGIASLTTLMAEDDFTSEQKEQIDLVKETSINALDLINEILEAANAASIPPKLELTDVNIIAGNCVELLRFKAVEKGQQIILTTLNKALELYISREKIWRVISNLVSNAIKFSPTGASIFVQVTEAEGSVIVAVEDNGIGIPEKLQGQVFNMFTSAQRLGTAGERSFGLGLSICRQIMEQFNGKIWFESKKEGGTIFYISLPIADKYTENNLSQKITIPLS